MAISPVFSSTSLLSSPSLKFQPSSHKILPVHAQNPCRRNSQKRVSFKIQAAKLPAGVELPKQEPKFQAPFLGFTKTAEIWNSRACMIGLIGIFIVELILNRGILQIIGVDVGKGLDLPL